jgi:hypothetical protein
MIFHYDLCQAEPIIRDYPVYDTSTINYGEALAMEGAITTAANRMFLQSANAAVLDNIVGVAQETVTASTSAASTGVTCYAKVLINPTAIYLCEYSQHGDDDTVNNAADTAGNDTTATFTTDREGDWIYVTDEGSTIGGAGNLYQIGLSNDTTSVTACTSYDDYLKATNTSDTFIVITNPFSALAVTGHTDLSAATGYSGRAIKGVAATGAGALMILLNYIQTPSLEMQPLRVEQHSGKNFNAGVGVHLYADVQFMSHLLMGGTGARVIS